MRHFLLVAGAISSIHLIITHLRSRDIKVASPLLPLIAFFAWIFIHFLFFASDRDAQFDELTSLWLRSFLAAIIGAGFALASLTHLKGSPTQDRVNYFLLIGLSGTLVIYLLRYGYEVLLTGKIFHMNFFITPFQGKPQIIVFVMLFIAAIYAGIKSRSQDKTENHWLAIFVCAILLALFTFYTANTKNGILIFSILTGLFAISFFLKQKITPIKMVVIALSLLPILFFGYKHIENEPAWRNMLADAKVGLDIENQTYWKNWKDGPTPINELGNHANQSTYLRTAWAAAAAELIHDRPLGYGLMSYSFTYMAQEKWPDFDTKNGRFNVATHSGWIDLTLALGLPATFLLLFSLGKSFFLSLGKKEFLSSYTVWATISLVWMYSTVEVSFDVFFEVLLFLAAFFAVLSANNEVNANRKNRSS